MQDKEVDASTIRKGDQLYMREAATEPQEFQRAKLMPTRQGDFTYGLDWERTHGPTEE